MSNLKYPNMVPLQFALNFQPDIELGIIYKTNSLDKKKRIYWIKIEKLFLLRDSDRIAEILYIKHPQFLDKKKIPKKKLTKILDKMIIKIFNDLDDFNEDEDDYEEDVSNNNNQKDDKKDFLKEIENLKKQKTDNINWDVYKYKRKSYEI